MSGLLFDDGMIFLFSETEWYTHVQYAIYFEASH